MITLVSSEWQDSGDCQFERFWPNSVSQTREVLTIFQHNNVKSRAQEPNVMPKVHNMVFPFSKYYSIFNPILGRLFRC